MLSSIDAELKVLDGMELRVKVMSGHLTNPNKIERHGIQKVFSERVEQLAVDDPDSDQDVQLEVTVPVILISQLHG